MAPNPPDARYRSQKPPRQDPVNGLLLVDKPTDWTSHDVVAKVRNHFKLRKVGHGGTLDPMATGLLVLLLGRATKWSQRVMSSDKTYEGLMALGRTTDSQDVDGERQDTRPIDGITEDAVRAAMKERIGDQYQMPPMHSAIKKDGVPLYKLARKGKSVKREPRFIHVYAFECLGFTPPIVAFRVRCTKGAYVRTLCADIGESMGCGAYLHSLRRTQSGPLSVANAEKLHTLLQVSDEELAERVLTLDQLTTKEW